MGFRTTVCLSKLFSDERSLCYIHINETKYKLISNLEDYLKNLFKICGDFCLMVDNCYLPSEESIKIVEPGEGIRVVPLQAPWKTDSKENDVVENVDFNDSDNIPHDKVKKKKKKKTKLDSENHKSVNVEMSPVKEPMPKKKQAIDEVDSKISEEESQPVSSLNYKNKKEVNEYLDESDVDTDMEQEGDTDNLQQLKSKAITLLGELSSGKQLLGVSNGRINKRKRIRKKNKKNALPLSLQNEVAETKTSQPVYKTNAPSCHIKFCDDEPLVLQNANIEPNTLIKPRIIPAVENLSVCNTNGITNSAYLTSTPKVIEVPTLSSKWNDSSSNESGVNIADEVKSDHIITKEDISLEILKGKLSNYPVMDSVFPVANDLIMFKTLKLDEKLTPTVTGFILAQVIEVNKTRGIIKICIIDGFSECPWLKNGESEEEGVSAEAIVDAPWSQIIEPRLVFP